MNSKAKGGQFEREVCVALSRWVTHGARKDCFWRSAMSGGRATVHGVGDVRQCGDVTAVAPEGAVIAGRYFIECKHVKTLDIHGLLKGTGLLLKYWAKTQRETEKHAQHKKPILIARQNMLPTVFCTEPDDLTWGFLTGDDFKSLAPILIAPRYQLKVYLFDDILKLRYTS